MPNMTLEETDDGFILSQADVSILLSQADLFGLKSRLDSWATRMLTHAQAESGLVSQIVVHAIAHAKACPDALQANVVLTVIAPTGEPMNLELPPAVANQVIDETTAALRDLRSANPAKQ